jgi:hypothetical protein
VDYAVADEVLGPYHCGDNSRGPRLLRTEPGKLIGPGHNSIFPGREPGREYIAFHAWDMERKQRRMHTQPLVWTGEGPRVEWE